MIANSGALNIDPGQENAVFILDQEKTIGDVGVGA